VADEWAGLPDAGLAGRPRNELLRRLSKVSLGRVRLSRRSADFPYLVEELHRPVRVEVPEGVRGHAGQLCYYDAC